LLFGIGALGNLLHHLDLRSFGFGLTAFHSPDFTCRASMSSNRTVCGPGGRKLISKCATCFGVTPSQSANCACVMPAASRSRLIFCAVHAFIVFAGITDTPTRLPTSSSVFIKTE